MNKTNPACYRFLENQYKLLSLPDGTVDVNYVFDMSRLDLIAEYFAKKTGGEFNIPFANKSPKKELELSESLVEPLMKKLELDLKIYDVVSSKGFASSAEINAAI